MSFNKMFLNCNIYLVLNESNKNKSEYKNIHLYKGKMEIKYNVIRSLTAMKDHFFFSQSNFIFNGRNLTYFNSQ